MRPAYDLENLRGHFPICEQMTYLNHASISPLPAPVRARMDAAAAQLARDPGAFFSPHPPPEFGDIFVDLSQTVAGLIHAAHPGEIVGMQSTSAAINAVTQAIDWQPGDNIVFSRQEFPSNAYPWMVLEPRGVACRIVPDNGTDNGTGGATVAAFEPYVDDRTRVIAVSAVQFLTGQRADLAALGAFCRARGILFVVDAIQAAGHIPIDVQTMHIDVLAAGGQKSLMGPPGQGFLYVRDKVCETMQPGIIGPNATDGWEFWADYDLAPRAGAARFMMGTPNVTGMVGLAESIRFLCGVGIAAIDDWTRHLSALAIDDLTAQGCTVITPRDSLGPVVTFRLWDVDPDDGGALAALDEATGAFLARLVAERVRVTRHLDQHSVPHLRISTHCYNTEDEVRQVGAILEDQHG